jgi:O-antigen/teichoic acid export membrane protein
MLLKKRLLDGVKSAGFSAAVVNVLHLVQLLVLARLLAPSDFGLMGMAGVVVGYATLVADMGIGSAIIHRQSITKESLSSLYWLSILLGIAVFFALWSLTSVVVAVYSEPRLGNVMFLLTFLFLITPIGQQFQILLEKTLEFGRLAKIEVGAAGIGAIVAIGIGLARSDVFALVGGTLADAGAKALMLVVIGWKEWRPSLIFRWKDVKGYVGFGLYHAGQRSVNYMTANVDFFLIGSLLGAQALGYYKVAYDLANLPSSKINAALSRVFFPAFAVVQNDIERLKRGYLQMQEFTSMVNIPLLLGMAVVAPVAIPLLFGPWWAPSALLLQILVVVGLSRSIGGTVGPLLLAMGRPGIGFQWSILIVFIQVPGIYIGVLSGSAVGVATAFAILACVYLVLNYVLLIRTLLGSCIRDYVMRIWPYVWMSTITATAVIGVSMFLSFLPPPLLLLVQITSGVAIYTVLLWHKKKPLLLDATRLVFVRDNL